MYYPINYENINVAAGYNMPSAVKSYNNKSFMYWERSLFQRACSPIELTVPEEWEGNVKDFLYYCLLRFGYVAISKNDKYGQFFQPCTLQGYDLYYQPVKARVSNPAFTSSLEMEIGKECELLRLTPDYFGIWDTISYYAEKLALLDAAINMSLVNSKLAYILGAKNRSAAKALQKALDLINKGEPAVILDLSILNDPTDKSEPWQFLERSDMKSNYLTTDELNDFRTIINNFDAEIGLKNVNNKKERLLTDEIESNNDDSSARCDVWIRTLESSIVKIKKLYPDINLSVKKREPEMAQKGAEDVEK